MAVTIEKRPIGVILGTGVTASINQDYGTLYATVNKTSHGLADGEYVYIQSNVENYNGFWKIDVTNANEFILIDNPYVEFIVAADITYYPQVTTHGWSCAHLPIVYELSNTKFPTNSVDTARTISSISDDNGYVNCNLSGSLGTFEDLAFIKISNASNSDYDGVYQIIDKLATNDVTLNLAYSSITASGLVGATIQLYYSNYNIVVQVYAGLNASHYWQDQKPYELAATLELIPDSTNRVKFSINEVLKAYIETSNNLLQPTLPNDLDQFTQFYISVTEQYDTSNGYTVTSYEGGFASDQSAFEGYAVNAMLPFKNIYSGYLSEYVMTNTTAKFLTLFSVPIMFVGCTDAYDISFINPYDSAYTLMLKEQYYTNDVLQQTFNTHVSGGDEGVIRFFLENAFCAYDTVLCSLNVTGVPDLVNGEFTSSGDNWANSGSGETWAYSAGDIVVEVTGVQSSKRWEQDYDFIKGVTYSVSFTITVSGTDVAGWFVRAYASNDDYTQTQSIAGGGPYTSDPGGNVVISTTSFLPTKSYTKIYFIVEPNIP